MGKGDLTLIPFDKYFNYKGYFLNLKEFHVMISKADKESIISIEIENIEKA
jgi:hypothetical protein